MTKAPDDQAVDESQQPFLEHIVELRSRILRSLSFVGLLFLPIYYFAEPLFTWVAEPLMSRLPEGAGMIATQVASPFLAPFKLAMCPRTDGDRDRYVLRPLSSSSSSSWS